MGKVGYLFLGAVVASLSTFYWAKNFNGADRMKVEELLKLNDSELLEHSSEIKKLDGLEGKIMLALLACVGMRKSDTASAAPVQVQVQAPAPAPNRQPPLRDSGNVVSTGQSPLTSNVESPPSNPSGSSTAGSTGPTAQTGARLSAVPENFFCGRVVGQPTRVEDAGWDKLFPFDAGTQPNTADFGMVEGEHDGNASLESRICESPGFWQVTAERRKESQFFRQIRGKVFDGPLQLIGTAASAGGPHRMHFHSNPQHHNDDKEYMGIYRRSGTNPGDVFESRWASYAKTHGVWRYNPCFRSVALVNSYCPWGDSYDREYKDFFFLSSSRQLAGNVYCRKRSDHTWVRLGKFVLRPNSSEHL